MESAVSEVLPADTLDLLRALNKWNPLSYKLTLHSCLEIYKPESEIHLPIRNLSFTTGRFQNVQTLLIGWSIYHFT